MLTERSDLDLQENMQSTLICYLFVVIACVELLYACMPGGGIRGAIANTRMRVRCIAPQCCGRLMTWQSRALSDE